MPFPLWVTGLLLAGAVLRFSCPLIKYCPAAGICHVMSGNAFHAVLVRLCPLPGFFFFLSSFPSSLLGAQLTHGRTYFLYVYCRIPLLFIIVFLWQQACCQIYFSIIPFLIKTTARLTARSFYGSLFLRHPKACPDASLPS